MFRKNICSIFAIVLAAANVAAASPVMSVGAQEVTDTGYAYEAGAPQEETETVDAETAADGTYSDDTQAEAFEAADAGTEEITGNTDSADSQSGDETEEASDDATTGEESIDGAVVEDYEAGARWVKSGSTWYYYGANGQKRTGWQWINGRWYYLNPSNGAMVYGWRYLSWSGGKNWFYFGSSSDGSMKTGWQYLSWSGGKNWFYFDGNGAMKTGWQQLKWSGGNDYFYFDSNGALAVNTTVDGYKVDANGVRGSKAESGSSTTTAAKDGWVKSSGTWYYYKNGKTLTGWQKLGWSGGSSWFYFDGNGAMKTGWQYLGWSGGKNWFYFDGNGAMKTGWQYLGWSGGKNWFYFDSSNGAMKTGWLDVGGKRYYLTPPSGAMVTGTNTIDGVTYTMGSDGALTGSGTSTGTSSSQVDMNALKSQLQSMANSAGGTWGIYVKDLSTGQTLDINATKSMMSASIIKIFIAGAYYDAVANGKVAGSYDSTVRKMIVYSDNSATNTLINLVGMSNINSFISKKGFSGTKLNRKMLASGTENYVSMKDCGDVLEQIYNRTYVNSSASEKIWSYLKAQDSRNKIPAGISDSKATIGNKTGEIAGNKQGAYVIGDVALVYGSKANMVICIVENGKYSSTVKSTISKMAGAIYSACNK